MVGEGDVVFGDFNVSEAVLLFFGALVLMEEGDAANEGEVFHVVTARSGALAHEGELGSEGVDDVERFEEALRVFEEGELLLGLGLSL